MSSNIRSKAITFVLFICSVILQSIANAQCNTTINSFPYLEDFENSDGNWFVANNSIKPDWEWGTPSKSIINSAGSGTKCWITGGLHNDSYNDGEESFLQSPCFNISSLQNPVISFKIFWATESKFDGAGLQYSIDGGNNWANLGTVADYTSCPSTNWFNTTSIKYVNTKQGWSGSSNQWVTAVHSLSAAKGASKVAFRFVFGAGTINNDYDGVAIDDVFIGEAPPFNPVFAYTCAGNNTINFTDASINCPTSFSWNFGDPSSGTTNTDNHENPTHHFSAPGTYTITFTANSATTGPGSTQQQVTVLAVTATTNNISCYKKNDGSATAIPYAVNGTYSYLWNTNPQAHSQTIDHLPAGTYTVTISALNACPASATVHISEPTAIASQMQVINELCNNGNGSISSTVTGGTPPYSYLWSNNQTTPGITHLSAGNYSLQVTDHNNCSGDFNDIIISNSSSALHLFLGNDTSICSGHSLILHAGNYSSYLWQDNSIKSTYTVTTTGTYWVKVKDNNGCSATDSIHVMVDCSNVYFPSAFSPNRDGLNDMFGVEGNVAALKNYSLTIYNRWGQVVFQSKNPAQKWDGKFKGSDADAGTYIWVAGFSLNSHPPEIRKGTITILR